jgi:hypothetical protein
MDRKGEKGMEKARAWKIVVVFFFITICLFRFSADVYADLSTDVAEKTYQVKFADWVEVYLHVAMETSSEDYAVYVNKDIIDNKHKFYVGGYYLDTPNGKFWYETVGSKIEKRIRKLCDIWTVQGYPISLNDFEIEIRRATRTVPNKVITK